MLTKEGQACLFAGSHPRIYGAALERESLTKIYGPAYLLGVVPTHDTERLLPQPPCAADPLALSPGWNSSTLQQMGQQPLSQERKALTSSVPVQS